MELADEIRADAERGAERLVAECRAPLVAFAARLCGDAAEAEDLAFRAMEKAVANISSYKGEGSFEGWLKTILRNDFVSSRRRKSATAPTLPLSAAEDTAMPDDAPGGSEAAAALSDGEVVRAAIRSLSPQLREAIILHYFLDQPIAQIAKFLSVPAGTVKFRLHYARKALAGKLSRTMKRPAAMASLAGALVLAAVAATTAIVGTRRGEDGRAAVLCGLGRDGERPTRRVEGNAPYQTDSIFDANGETEGEGMIMTRKVASLVGASVLSVASAGAELTSEPTFVFLKPETSSFWNTATNSAMTLPIDYPMGASSAELTVRGVGYTAKYSGITDDSFDLELPPPNSPEEENVYDLSLAFDDGTVRTAKLGLVQGAAAGSAGVARCIAPAEGSVWGKFVRRAVVPIPYGTTSLKVSTDGETWQDVDTGLGGAQGWYALRSPGSATEVTLALVKDGVQCLASLIGESGGFFVIVR